MDRIKVNGSSNIDSVGYDESDRILEVAFANKKGGDPSVYQYAGVPHNVWVELMRATSKGTFIHANLKGKFTATRVQ